MFVKLINPVSFATFSLYDFPQANPDFAVSFGSCCADGLCSAVENARSDSLAQSKIFTQRPQSLCIYRMDFSGDNGVDCEKYSQG